MRRTLIAEQIVFDEDQYVLYRHSPDHSEPLKLGAIASRCLAQLLSAQGSVVLKRDLMNGAWGQFGLEVTDNSLAQVVRQLRVAFEKFVPNQEFIVTLPRIGYKFSESVALSTLDTETDTVMPVTTNPDLTASVASPTADPITLASSSGDLPPASLSREPARQSATDFTARRPSSWQAWGVVAALCLIALTGTARWSSRPPLPTDPLILNAPFEHKGLLVYLRTASPPLTDTQAQTYVERAKKMASLAVLDGQPLHLYLINRRELMGFVCDLPLETVGRRCLGVFEYAKAP